MKRTGNLTPWAAGVGTVLLALLWTSPASAFSPTPEADVFLTKIHDPKGVKPSAGGDAKSKTITVQGDADARSQMATVKLRAVAGAGLKVAIIPGSIDATMHGGTTSFRFSAEISCKAGTKDTSWAIRWFATIGAPENSNTGNDELEGRTDVTCR